MDEIAVRQIRAALGMSIEQFALAIGVSKTSVKNWEAGLSKPNQANLLKMVEIAVTMVKGQSGLNEPDFVYVGDFDEGMKKMLREMAALIRRMEKAKS